MSVRSLPLLAAVMAALAAATPARAAELGLNVNGGGAAVGNLQNFEDLSTLHARWARHFVFWDDIDEGGFGAYEAMMAEEGRRGVKTLLTLTSARGQAPADPDAFARFAGALAGRFSGQAEAYQIWNESDEGLFWSGGPNPRAYVEVLRKTYAAIKQADPGAIVVFSPTVGNNYDFVAAAYAAGANGSFDAMAVHTDTACLDRPPGYFYREGDGRLGRFTFLGYREVHRVMQANGDGDKPIWMTEFGWSAANHTCEFGSSAGRKPAGVSEEQQAAFLLEAMNCLERDPYVQVALWFNNRDLHNDGKMANMYGLRRYDGSARPAFAAFRTWGSGGGRSQAPCGDFEGPPVRVLSPAPSAVLPPASPLYIRAHSGAGDLSRIRFRVPGTRFGAFRSLAPEPNGAGEITWEEAARLPPGDYTLEVVAFDHLGNPGPPAVLPFRRVSGRGGLQPVTFPKLRLTGRGRARTLRGGSPPGIVGGALRVEWRKKKGRRWVRYHARTVIARRPFLVRQRLRAHGLWRVRAVFLGKPPHRRTASCWFEFRTSGKRTRLVCPRRAVRPL